VDLAYAAGIMDGEGTIGITEYRPDGKRRKTPDFRPYVGVIMTDPVVPNWLARTFSVGSVNHYAGRQANHKPTYSWRLGNRQALDFCRVLLPHLKIKQAQAALLVEFYERLNFAGGYRVSAEAITARQEFVKRIKVLNKRGVA
jgi:hypothetical protein